MAKTAAPILRFLLLFTAMLAVALGLAALSPSADASPEAGNAANTAPPADATTTVAPTK